MLSKTSWSAERESISSLDTVTTNVARISRIHDALLLQQQKHDLHPCPATNRLFTELVSISIQILDEGSTAKIMHAPEILKILPSLRALCSQGEYHLEAQWSEFLAQTTRPPHAMVRLVKRIFRDASYAHAPLRRFPYYTNYVDLTRMELAAIKSVAHDVPLRSIAVIGSGPMPLTSLCLVQHQSRVGERTTAMSVDIDPKAIDLASHLCRRLGGRGIEFVCAGPSRPALDLSTFDVVYLAALVGMTQSEKEVIIIETTERMRANALLVIRTAWGLRGLLYPDFEVTSDRLLRVLDVCRVIHPYDEVVNSVIISKVKPRSYDDKCDGMSV